MSKKVLSVEQFHYVYRITNTKTSKHYYGTRSCKIKPRLDLGIKYFSSSSDGAFIQSQKTDPSIFKYKIVRTFPTRLSAISFEIVLHKKFDVCKNQNFYNRSKQTSTGWDTSGTDYSIIPNYINCLISRICDKKLMRVGQFRIWENKQIDPKRVKPPSAAKGIKKRDAHKLAMRKPKSVDTKTICILETRDTVSPGSFKVYCNRIDGLNTRKNNMFTWFLPWGNYISIDEAIKHDPIKVLSPKQLRRCCEIGYIIKSKHKTVIEIFGVSCIGIHTSNLGFGVMRN